MRAKITLSAATLLLLSATACKKSSEKGALDGSWAFTSVQTKGTSTVEYNDGDEEKSITTSDYTSTNNKGTIAISGNTMSSKGIAYTIDTELSYVSFMDDQQSESGTTHYSVDIPASSSTASFKLIGTDSIAFTAGVSTPGGGQTGAGGGKYTLGDNKLTMTIHLDTTFTDNVTYGFPVQKHDVATQTTVLTRQ
jgi:hypothetical protein